MNANHIESKFAMMGARLKVSVLPEQRVSEDYAMDIQRDRHGEYFELRVPETLSQPRRVVLCPGQRLATGPHQREVHSAQRTASSRYG